MDNLNPFNPLAKSVVSIEPLVIANPPINPCSAFNTPAFVTLNGAFANVEFPN